MWSLSYVKYFEIFIHILHSIQLIRANKYIRPTFEASRNIPKMTFLSDKNIYIGSQFNKDL